MNYYYSFSETMSPQASQKHFDHIDEGPADSLGNFSNTHLFIFSGSHRKGVLLKMPACTKLVMVSQA